LIVFSTLLDYSVGRQLALTELAKKRKILLWISILVNLGFLGFFKYYNFFVDNFVAAFSFFGTPIKPNTLNIILPVGISFYTFQTLSYTIDVYRKRLEPTEDIVAFAAFVSFFPQLVAGPIERASNLLPQFYKKRQFDYAKAVNGMRQILWGFFKKIVIADNCAVYANEIFNNSSEYSGSTLFMGALFFTFQIYGDFSGYSDIAIGTSRLFGFNLMQNFSFPYFSRDIAEFWRRWHISLSTWFRDYLYIPLGGSRGGRWQQIRNVFIIFIVSGFWHGANWTFIIWGALNAFYFIPLLLTNYNRHHLGVVAEHSPWPSFTEMFLMGFTFFITVITWVFFRAEDIDHAITYIANIFEYPGSYLLLSNYTKYSGIINLVILFIVIEWIGRRNQFAIETIYKIKNKSLRWLFYFSLVIVITYQFATLSSQEFIYFDF
jgi:D-alanyl-lipoteichoic acid acyltransferase DltB (MBOAT superfamily)